MARVTQRRCDYTVVNGIRITESFIPETFGRLTTIGPQFMLPSGTQGKHRGFQVCRCVCATAIVVSRTSLKRENTGSCGCLKKDILLRRNIIHGKTNTAEHNIWHNMIQRCNNTGATGYCNYGGRGIRVCDRWLEFNGQGFLNFLSDMGERPSVNYQIERAHNDGDYTPENCKWALRAEQGRNRRNNHLLTYEGKTQCMVDWSKETGISRSAIRHRLNNGWTIEKTLTTPSRVTKRRSNG